MAIWFLIQSSLVAQRWRLRLQCRGRGFDLWVRKIPWRRKWQPTPVFLPGESHGQRSLVGYSPWGHKRVGHNLAIKQQHPGVHSPYLCPEVWSKQISNAYLKARGQQQGGEGYRNISSQQCLQWWAGLYEPHPWPFTLLPLFSQSTANFCSFSRISSSFFSSFQL